MRSIIVPIDFSEFTDAILEEVVHYAKTSDSKVYLLHVASLDLGFVIGDIGFQYLPELEEAGMKQETDELSKYEEKLKKEGINVEIIIKQGTPSEIIIETVEEKKGDIIIMGSHGRNVIMEAILGSVSKDVIKKSHVPILVVPPKKKKKTI